METLQTEEALIQDGDKIQVEDNVIVTRITRMKIKVEVILLVLLEIFLEMVDSLVVLMVLEEEEVEEVLYVRSALKHNHSVADCRDKFNSNFVPTFSMQGNFPS